jgi:hypothetical protein
MGFILLTLIITAGCTALSDGDPKTADQPALSTPIVVKERTPVQKVEITQTVDDPRLELNSTAAPTQVEIRAELENLGPAPELVNETWLNTEQPLRLADLAGKVVLLEMWTFG